MHSAQSSGAGVTLRSVIEWTWKRGLTLPRPRTSYVVRIGYVSTRSRDLRTDLRARVDVRQTGNMTDRLTTCRSRPDENETSRVLY